MALSSLTNLAISTVATAPSPATSGTSFVVTTGQGSRFPASGSFPVVIWPTSVTPTPANAEIALCTAVSTDTLTITRAQEGTAARTVVVGDQVMMAITKAVLDGMAVDVQTFAASGTWTKPVGAKWIHVKVGDSGAGGGSGRRGATSTDRSGGGGGASGALSEHWLSATAVDASCTVTVGAGGGGGAAVTVDSTNGNAGSAGNPSSFRFNASESLSCKAVWTGTAGGGGGGATTSGAGGTAISTSNGQFTGGAGGAGSNGSGSTGGTIIRGSTGGGGGGGITSGNSASTSSNFAVSDAISYGLVNKNTSGDGVAGYAPPSYVGMPGRGGSGGNPSTTQAAGAGGAGSVPGGGGGGGGASTNGFNSGAGGNGGDGQVIVTTYF